MDLIVGNFSGGLDYFTSQVQPEVISSVAGAKKSDIAAFKVYPNPVRDCFYIQSDLNWIRGPLQITLFNALGQKVLQRTLSSDSIIKIGTGGIPNGIYMLRIGQNNSDNQVKFFSFKLIILQ